MALNFGPARDYNVFVFGDMNLSNTDAEGRVAVGGNATLSNYGVGAGITPLPPANTDLSLVIGGNVNINGGSNASGNTVINLAGTVINYTMGNPNGLLTGATPIDFAAAEEYLKCASRFWHTLPANGSGEVVFNQLNLTGTHEELNIFTLDAENLYGTGLSLAQLNGINIIAPLEATILINVEGTAIQYGSYQIFRNGQAATRENARRILWNFPQALTWSNSTTAIYGSVLAPYAAANTTYSQINGNIVFASFSGNAESHNELFLGELPEADACPATPDTPPQTPVSRNQAITDLLVSVALQQAAISHILNGEGEKVQRILAMDSLTPATLLQTNRSVESMVNSISRLEAILTDKIALFKGCLGSRCPNPSGRERGILK